MEFFFIFLNFLLIYGQNESLKIAILPFSPINNCTISDNISLSEINVHEITSNDRFSGYEFELMMY